MTMKTFRKRVQEVVLQSVRTTDAARPTKDALLTCPTAAEWAEYTKSVAKVDLGRVWDGFEASMEALDEKQREMICDRFDAYRETKGRKKARGSLDSDAPDFDIFGRREAAKVGQAINDANARAWNQQSPHGRGRIAK
jgi:hypothetical protein